MSAPPEAHVPAWLLRLWGSAAKEQSDQAVAEAPEGGTKPPESNPDGSGADTLGFLDLFLTEAL